MTAQKMWEYFVSCRKISGEYSAWSFGDDADTLAKLTLEGTKTATASAYPLYELEEEPLPQAGEYSVVLDSRGDAVCVIQTTRVFTVPFRQVDETQAFREGEGDRSLAYWRRVHVRFFREEMAAAGLGFTEDMMVVCEEFTCVYP